MKSLFIIICFLFPINVLSFNQKLDCTCGKKSLIRLKRLTNGKPAIEDNDPWFASLLRLIRNNTKVSLKKHPFCGGTLISDRYLLTAASCLENLKVDDFIIVFNLYNLKQFNERETIKFKAEEIKVHPEFDLKNNFNNLALVKLSKTIEFRLDFNVLPICLIKSDSEDFNDKIDYYPGPLYTLGWGRLSNNTFNQQFSDKLQISYFRQDFFWCSFFFSRKFMKKKLCTVDNRIVHFTFRDVCDKDSGGPLIYQYNENENKNKFLVGISEKNDCSGRLPITFTKVKSYLKWIENNTRDSDFCRHPDIS